MADTKVSNFGASPAIDPAADLIPIIDVSASGNARCKTATPEKLREVMSGLPVWMFDASDGSDPDPGCFTTDNASVGSTTSIKVANVSKSGDPIDPFIYLAIGGRILSYLILTGPDGRYGAGYPTVIASVPGYWQFTIALQGTGNWQAGDYHFSATPRMSDITLGNLLLNETITPVADGTVGDLTTAKGIVTAVAAPPTSGDGTFALSATLGGSITILNGRVTSFTPAG